MPTAYIDRIDNLTFTERNGVIRSLTRKARVLFSRTETIPPDFSVLSAATAVCPIPYSQPMDMTGTAIAGYKHLALVERTPSVVENDTSVVDVILKYDHILDGPNQGLIKPFRGKIFGKGRSSIADKTTNFFVPNGGDSFVDGDDKRIQLLAAHCFIPKDPGAASQCQDPTLLQTALQGGEISVPFPQANFGFQGYIYTSAPWNTVWKYIARINLLLWCGKPPFTWICSEVQFEVLDPSPVTVPAGITANTPLYKFSFEFQYNVDTRNPTVVFHDQRTGRPPAYVAATPTTLTDLLTGITTTYTTPIGLIRDPATGVKNLQLNPFADTVTIPPQATTMPAGMWTVPFLKPIDFNAEFGAIFEGVPPPGIV